MITGNQLTSKSRWKHNWKSAEVVNFYLVCNPTIRQPGFDLPRQQWSLLNRFRTEQGHCGEGMATYRHWSVSLWWDPDDVPHCRILSPDKTEWRLISATLCGWGRCFVADQLWFITRIREEEWKRNHCIDQTPLIVELFDVEYYRAWSDL